MGRDMADLADSLAAMPHQLRQAQLVGVRKAALHSTRIIRTEIRKVSGDMRLSGVGRNGARVNAAYTVRGSLNPTALIVAKGPLHLVERDTAAHDIGPRKRRGKRAALKVGDGFARRVTHPGTRGQAPFARGVALAARETADIFEDEVRRRVKTAFGQQ